MLSPSIKFLRMGECPNFINAPDTSIINAQATEKWRERAITDRFCKCWTMWKSSKAWSCKSKALKYRCGTWIQIRRKVVERGVCDETEQDVKAHSHARASAWETFVQMPAEIGLQILQKSKVIDSRFLLPWELQVWKWGDEAYHSLAGHQRIVLMSIWQAAARSRITNTLPLMLLIIVCDIFLQKAEDRRWRQNKTTALYMSWRAHVKWDYFTSA